MTGDQTVFSLERVEEERKKKKEKRKEKGKVKREKKKERKKEKEKEKKKGNEKRKRKKEKERAKKGMRDGKFMTTRSFISPSAQSKIPEAHHWHQIHSFLPPAKPQLI